MSSSENSNFYYVYVLKSESRAGELYIGYTMNLKRRVEEHNKGQNFSTKPYRPWRLIYFEGHRNKDDAKRRERYLKTSQGSRLIQRMLREYLYANKN